MSITFQVRTSDSVGVQGPACWGADIIVRVDIRQSLEIVLACYYPIIRVWVLELVLG